MPPEGPTGRLGSSTPSCPPYTPRSVMEMGWNKVPPRSHVVVGQDPHPSGHPKAGHLLLGTLWVQPCHPEAWAP